MCTLLLVLTLTVFLDATSTLSLPTPEPECGPNEMPGCNDNCTLTCKNRIRGYMKYCPEDCPRTRCVCLPGFYRHDDGTCVRQSHCSPPQCNEGEVYDPCGTSRMETCAERGNTCDSQPLHCVEGCFCPEGFFLDTNSTCVPEEQCPPRSCSGPNEYFDVCPLSADQSCTEIGFKSPEALAFADDMKSAKQQICCLPGCRCITGYYRNTEGICIPEDQCDSDCEQFADDWLVSEL